MYHLNQECRSQLNPDLFKDTGEHRDWGIQLSEDGIRLDRPGPGTHTQLVAQRPRRND